MNNQNNDLQILTMPAIICVIEKRESMRAKSRSPSAKKEYVQIINNDAINHSQIDTNLIPILMATQQQHLSILCVWNASVNDSEEWNTFAMLLRE